MHTAKIVTTTTTTTTTTRRVVVTPHASPIKKASVQPLIPSSASRTGSVHRPSSIDHPIPRPEDLAGPEEGEITEGYYLVTVGQQCGIFFSWCVSVLPLVGTTLNGCHRDECHARVDGIVGSCYKKYPSWQEAYARYSRSRANGLVRAIPRPNSKYWTVPGSPYVPPLPRTDSPPPESDSDSELWSATSFGDFDDDELSTYLEDLSL